MYDGREILTGEDVVLEQLNTMSVGKKDAWLDLRSCRSCIEDGFIVLGNRCLPQYVRFTKEVYRNGADTNFLFLEEHVCNKGQRWYIVTASWKADFEPDAIFSPSVKEVYSYVRVIAPEIETPGLLDL